MRTLHDPRVTYKLRDNAGLDNLSISVTTSVHKVLSRDPRIYSASADYSPREPTRECVCWSKKCQKTFFRVNSGALIACP